MVGQVGTTSLAADGIGPEDAALLADSVGLALLVVLDTLAPAERLAFVLHDMFAVPYDEVAAVVGRSPDAARQTGEPGAAPVAGVVVAARDGPFSVMAFTVTGGKIVEIDAVSDPERLRLLDLAVLDG